MDETEGLSYEKVFGSAPQDNGSVGFKDIYPAPARTAPPAQKSPDRPVYDVGMSLGSGLLKGTAAVFGAPGDVSQLSQTAHRYLAGELGPKIINWGEKRLREEMGMEPRPEEEYQARQKEAAERAEAAIKYMPSAYLSKISPTTEDIVNYVQNLTGYDLYEPKTKLGRYTRTGAEFVPGMFVGPGGLTKVGQKAVTGFASGFGSEAAGTLVEGTPLETPVRIGTAVAAGMAGDTAAGAINVRRRAGRAESAERIAARVAQERVADPSAVARAIEVARQQPLVPGVLPTSAQMARSPQLMSLQGEVYGAGQGGLNVNASDLLLQQEANAEALRRAADSAQRQYQGRIPSVTQDFSGVRQNPQIAASRDVFSSLDRLEALDYADQAAEWKNLEQIGASLNKGRMIAGIEDYIENLTVSKRSELPSDIESTLEAINNNYGPQIPINEIQDLRSKILRAGRDTLVPTNKQLLNDLAEQIRVLMEDPNNFTLGNQQAMGQWQRAIRKTREYHDKWSPIDEILGVEGRQWKSSPEAALEHVLRGGDAAQHIRQIRDTGLNIDPLLEEYMLGELTKNGYRTVVTADEISKFATKPRNAAIIGELPDLSARLSQLSDEASRMSASERMARINSGFVDASTTGDPNKIYNFISANKTDLTQGQPQSVAKYIDALENSAEKLSKVGHGQVASKDVYELLRQGDIATILFGKGMSRFISTVTGAAAGAVLSKVPFFQGLAEYLPAIGAFAGSGEKAIRAVSNLIFGTTEDEALRLLDRAMREPKVMEMLLRKPTPENVGLVMQLAKSAARPAAISTMQAVRPEAEQKAAGGRATYADGGMPFSGRVVSNPMRPHDLREANGIGPQAQSRAWNISTKPVEIAPGVLVSGGMGGQSMEGPGVRGNASGYTAELVAPNLFGVERLTGRAGVNTMRGLGVSGGVSYGDNAENVSLNADRMEPQHGKAQSQIMARYNKRFASGGRAKRNIDADVKALMNAAARAKKQIDSRTENILSMPDEAVVKALRSARAVGGRV